MNFRVRMGKMEKRCNFLSGFSEVEILVEICFQFRICVFLSRVACVFFLDRVTPGVWVGGKFDSALKIQRPLENKFLPPVFLTFGGS